MTDTFDFRNSTPDSCPTSAKSLPPRANHLAAVAQGRGLGTTSARLHWHASGYSVALGVIGGGGMDSVSQLRKHTVSQFPEADRKDRKAAPQTKSVR